MRKLLLSITFLLIANLSFSQSLKYKFGVQAGLNYSNFRGYEIPIEITPVYSESPAFAYLGGLYFEYQIKGRLSLKVDLNYERKSQKGDNYIEVRQSFESFPQAYNYTSKKNYDYLVLPIMLKYNFKENTSFYVNGGPFIGFLLKSNMTNDLEDIEGFNNASSMSTSDLNKKIDLGLSFGLGKTIKFNEKNEIFIEIRENLGLINTNKYGVWGDGNVKTNSLNLIIGYSLN